MSKDNKKNQLPLHGTHKPLYAVDYEHFDEYFIKNGSSDVRYLSVGRSSWDEHCLATKIFRYAENGDRWSRQSEEIPATRLVDTTIVLAAYLDQDGINIIRKGTFENQNEDIPTTRVPHDILQALGVDASNLEIESVKKRLRVLHGVLNDMRLRDII